MLLIGVPLLLSAIYLWTLAADRYVSESVVSVRQSGEQVPASDGLSLLLQGAGSGHTRQDSLLLRAYLRSRDLLIEADKQFDLRKAYSAPRLDLLFRLPPDANSDRFLDYFRERVEVLYDDESGLLTLRVQGFSAEQAQKLNALLVRQSERFINEISQRMARDQMAFSSGELERSRLRLAEVKGDMLAFQSRHKVLDPMSQAQASAALTSELQARLARLEVELKSGLAYMDPNAFQMRAIRAQISATQRQLDEESARATSETRQGRRINAVAAEYQVLQTELLFAEESFKAATLAYQTARLETSRKVKSLVLVQSPSLAEQPEYPRRLYDLAAIALGMLLVYGIVRLLLATIEDHLD